jgi:hypothetical protein
LFVWVSALALSDDGFDPLSLGVDSGADVGVGESDKLVVVSGVVLSSASASTGLGVLGF